MLILFVLFVALDYNYKIDIRIIQYSNKSFSDMFTAADNSVVHSIFSYNIFHNIVFRSDSVHCVHVLKIKLGLYKICDVFIIYTIIA